MKRELELYFRPDFEKISKKSKKHKHKRKEREREREREKEEHYKSESDSDVEDIEFNKLTCSNSMSAATNSVYSEDNHIYFNSEFNKKSIEMLINNIKKINEDFEKVTKSRLVEVVRPKPIYLHITSYGGSLLHCFKAIDAITRSKMEVHTIVEGYAASCGSLLAVIGVKRYMGKFACILMHQLSAGAIGKFKEIEDDYDNCKMMMEHIVSIYEKHTTMTNEQIRAQLDHDSWWNYDTCLANGLVDGEWIEK